MIQRWMLIAGLTGLLIGLASCGRDGRSTPDPLQPADPLAPPVGALDLPALETLPLARTPEGNALSGLGYARLHVTPELTGTLEFPRSLAGQGDQYRLSARPYFTGDHITLRSVRRTDSGAKEGVVVTLNIAHPFPRPANLSKPAIGLKRIDLHLFRPLALVLSNGLTQFNFPADNDTPVLESELLLNADGYLQPRGVLLNPTGFTANTYPYRHITPLDASAATTNYDPTKLGWTGNALLDPTGYGVFAQGTNYDVEFALAVEPGESLTLDLAILGEYTDPRLSGGRDGDRLPNPNNPHALVYVLPAGAGDLSAVSVEFPDSTSNTVSTMSGSYTRMVVSIVDWDNRAVQGSVFPNYNNLEHNIEVSRIKSVTALVPGVTANPVPGLPLPGGSGWPNAPIRYEVSLVNDAGLALPGFYTGLVRVEDFQNGANLIDLEEYMDGAGSYQLGTPLGAPLPTVAYQVFTLQVTPHLCEQVSLTLEDENGGTLANGDRVKFRLTRTNPAVAPGNWTVDAAFTGALVEDPLAVNAINLSSPYLSSATFGRVLNATRQPTTLTCNFAVGQPTLQGACAPVTVTIPANAPPSCPSGIALSDWGGGALDAGDTVRVSFTGIVDPDNTQAEIQVTAAFDFNNDGIVDETKVGSAVNGSITSAGTVGAAATCAVTLTLADNAGSMEACPTITAPVALGCLTGSLSSPGNLTLGTVTGVGGTTLRGGSSGGQDITGVRLGWSNVTGEGAYAIYRAEWPHGTSISNVVWSQVGEVGADVTIATHLFTNSADKQGKRWLYRVYPRCYSGGPNGATSQWAMVAFQDFEGTNPGALDGAPALPNDWTTNYESSSRSTIEVISGGNTISGNRTFQVTRMNDTLLGVGDYWATFSPPQLTASDRNQFGSTGVSYFEFNHSRGGSWNAGEGGFTILTRGDRPTNGHSNGGTGYVWISNKHAGNGYSTTTAANLSDLFSIGSQHAGQNFAFAGGPAATEFVRYNTAAGTLTSNHALVFLAFADTYTANSPWESQRIDDIAWIVY